MKTVMNSNKIRQFFSPFDGFVLLMAPLFLCYATIVQIRIHNLSYIIEADSILYETSEEKIKLFYRTGGRIAFPKIERKGLTPEDRERALQILTHAANWGDGVALKDLVVSGHGHRVQPGIFVFFKFILIIASVIFILRAIWHLRKDKRNEKILKGQCTGSK